MFDDKDINEKVDGVLSRTPPELEKVNENLDFIKQIEKEPLDSDTYTYESFGYETVDISAILKKNIWNRSIFTVDKLCKLFLKMDLEQKKKYLRKKRGLDFNWTWMILLVMGVAIALLVIFFLLPRLGTVI